MTFDEFYAAMCKDNNINIDGDFSSDIHDYCLLAFNAGADSVSSGNKGEQPTQDLVVGWRAIGAASGHNGQSLAVRHCYGTLPVTPIKLPKGKVAMTQEQIDILKQM